MFFVSAGKVLKAWNSGMQPCPEADSSRKAPAQGGHTKAPASSSRQRGISWARNKNLQLFGPPRQQINLMSGAQSQSFLDVTPERAC